MTKKEIGLSDENYYSNEADWQYMSVSQFKDFQKCEAAALAKLKGDWQPISNPTTLLVGNYVHSYFESNEAHEKFISENSDSIFKKNKSERAEFVQAIDMIEALDYDEFFHFIYQGEKEVIVTGELFGTTWKAKIDCLNIEQGYFVDLKTTRQLDMRYWSKKYGSYVSFIEEYGYVLQMGIYKKLLEQKYEIDEINPYIFAVTKESPPNIQAITIDPLRYDFEFSLVKLEIDHILEVKNGEAKPVRCEKCEYCRKTKKLNSFIEVGELLEKNY